MKVVQICFEGKGVSHSLEYLEEVLDRPTMEKIIEVCMGVVIGGPNLPPTKELPGEI